VYEGVVQDLIDELGRLPGVGPKGAQRIAFYLLACDPVDVRRLADVLVEVKEKVRFCATCGNVAEEEHCRICRDPRRDATAICVVEESKDVVAVERTREFRGRYHVLGGAISPIEGIGPDDLRIRELVQRLADGAVNRGHRGDRPQPGGGGDRDVSHAIAQANGLAHHPAGEWTAGRRRLGVRRRGDFGRAFEGRRAIDE
jgi:recombination protein RecR